MDIHINSALLVMIISAMSMLLGSFLKEMTIKDNQSMIRLQDKNGNSLSRINFNF